MPSLSIFRDFAERTVVGIIFAIVCIIAAAHFGQSEIFDPLILTAVIVLSVLFRHDVNVISLLALLALGRGIEELAWRFLDNSVVYKIPLYLLFIVLIPHIAKGWFKFYLLIFVAFAVGCEVYWFMTDYNAPMIYWQVFMVMLTAASRRAFVMRNFWFYDVFKNEAFAFIELDNKCRGAFSVLVAIYSVNAFEYFARHIFGLKDLVISYNLFPYTTGGVSLFIVYMLAVESTKQIHKPDLPA